MNIGWIGLGIMGRPMAKNLMKKGHQLWVMDHHRENVQELVCAGAKAAESGDIGKNCELVITMLPDGPNVKEALFGDEGIAEYMCRGSALIDMSSVEPSVTREISILLEQRGIAMLDAPVSGGEQGAVQGTLSIMVGGKKEIFEKFKPILECMGTFSCWCGEAGAGNVVKLANQIIVAVEIAACSEAFTLAKMAGINPQTVLKAIRHGLAGSTVMETKVPMMLAGDVRPGFKVDLHMKDLNNALNYAHAIGAPVPVTAQVQEMFVNLHRSGSGQEDHSGIARYYAKLSGISLSEQLL